MSKLFTFYYSTDVVCQRVATFSAPDYYSLNGYLHTRKGEKDFMSLFRPSDHTLTQGAKYVIVGVAAFLADFFCVWALTKLGHVYYLVSASIAFVLGLCVNYSLSVTWVLMWVFTEIAQIYYLVSKLMVTAVVFPLNFGIRKSFLFTARQSIA
jgi:putative flippase GtrA